MFHTMLIMQMYGMDPTVPQNKDQISDVLKQFWVFCQIEQTTPQEYFANVLPFNKTWNYTINPTGNEVA